MTPRLLFVELAPTLDESIPNDLWTTTYTCIRLRRLRPLYRRKCQDYRSTRSTHHPNFRPGAAPRSDSLTYGAITTPDLHPSTEERPAASCFADAAKSLTMIRDVMTASHNGKVTVTYVLGKQFRGVPGEVKTVPEEQRISGADAGLSSLAAAASTAVIDKIRVTRSA